MDVFKSLSVSEKLLIICSEDEKSRYSEKASKFPSATISTIDLLKDVAKDTIGNVVFSIGPKALNTSTLSELLRILKPKGKLIIDEPADVTKVEFSLKTGGFMNVVTENNSITAIKPKFAIGSSAKINLKKPVVWKLDEGDDDDDDLIDPDDLLDEADLKKPDPNSLKVCSTTGKRKACKDCSCGLAEELIAEAKNGKIVDTNDAPKSSCGSCYLGDAFRCATCPYLGMPAFKPGEKIQLTTSQLKSDI